MAESHVRQASSFFSFAKCASNSASLAQPIAGPGRARNFGGSFYKAAGFAGVNG
jgi:hypothetical protein